MDREKPFVHSVSIQLIKLVVCLVIYNRVRRGEMSSYSWGDIAIPKPAKVFVENKLTKVETVQIKAFNCNVSFLVRVMSLKIYSDTCHTI